jgi:hypothetical protein
LANDAFRALAEDRAADPDAEAIALIGLIALVPDLPAALARAHAEGGTAECRGAGPIVVRAAALPRRDAELHLMVWFDDAPSLPG